LKAAGAAVDAVHKRWQNVVTALDSCYKFGTSKNSEQVFRFFTLAIRCESTPQHAGTIAFLLAQGRMKFVRPLYRDLGASVTGATLARTTFAANKSMYHGICQKMVARDLA
jgi:leukotriene-A4 hydrolase